MRIGIQSSRPAVSNYQVATKCITRWGRLKIHPEITSLVAGWLRFTTTPSSLAAQNSTRKINQSDVNIIISPIHEVAAAVAAAKVQRSVGKWRCVFKREISGLRSINILIYTDNICTQFKVM